MPEVHQAPVGGKGGDPPTAHRALRELVHAAHTLRGTWSRDLEGPAHPRARRAFGDLVHELDAWLADVEAVTPAVAAGVAAPTLDLRERDAVRAWLADMRTQIDDVAAAGEDATRSPSRRALGRPTARRAIVEGRRSLEHLLSAAERGLESAASVA